MTDGPFTELVTNEGIALPPTAIDARTLAPIHDVPIPYGRPEEVLDWYTRMGMPEHLIHQLLSNIRFVNAEAFDMGISDMAEQITNWVGGDPFIFYAGNARHIESSNEFITRQLQAIQPDFEHTNLWWSKDLHRWASENSVQGNLPFKIVIADDGSYSNALGSQIGASLFRLRKLGFDTSNTGIFLIGSSQLARDGLQEQGIPVWSKFHFPSTAEVLGTEYSKFSNAMHRIFEDHVSSIHEDSTLAFLYSKLSDTFNGLFSYRQAPHDAPILIDKFQSPYKTYV